MDDMTGEEAIEVLITLKKLLTDNRTTELDDNEIEAVEIAIKALEQEPCDDCISRTEAINAFPDLLPNFGYNKKCIKEILQDLPSVQPKAEQEPNRKDRKWE